MFDGRMAVQPPLTDEQVAAVPARRGVVLLEAREGHPLVLLTAADLRARVLGRLRNVDDEDRRRKLPDLREVTTGIAWRLASSSFEADLRFGEIAEQLWPNEFESLLGWKPAWLACICPDAAAPHWVVARQGESLQGRCVGPFPGGRSGEQFISAIQDGFELCRDFRCLRSAPHGVRCSYGQMGRCVCVCDGTMSMDAYRTLTARSADFAAGQRQTRRQELADAMKQAAGKLEFERAAAIKSLLERLSLCDRAEYEHTAGMDRFRFLIMQSSGSRRRVNVFFADGGQITTEPPLNCPVAQADAAAMLESLKARPAAEAIRGRGDRWRVGLVAHYLFSSAQRRGVILRWDDRLSAQELCDRVHQAADALGITARARARKADRTTAQPLPEPTDADPVKDDAAKRPSSGA